MHEPGRLRELLDTVLRESGLSQRALARLAGMDESQIGRWRDGRTRPTYDNVLKVASVTADRWPALADTAHDLFAAAGYAAPRTLAAPDDRPEIVRQHWGNPAVREIWQMQTMPPDAKLGLVMVYLGRNGLGEDQAASLPGNGRI